MLRRILSLFTVGLILIGTGMASAGTVERRVAVLAGTRFAGPVTTLQLEGGQSIDVDLKRIEVIDLQRPARPARRSLKLAAAGSGLVLDFRRDASGEIRFGRIFITPNEARARAFMDREFRSKDAPQ